MYRTKNTSLITTDCTDPTLFHKTNKKCPSYCPSPIVPHLSDTKLYPNDKMKLLCSHSIIQIPFPHSLVLLSCYLTSNTVSQRVTLKESTQEKYWYFKLVCTTVKFIFNPIFTKFSKCFHIHKMNYCTWVVKGNIKTLCNTTNWIRKQHKNLLQHSWHYWKCYYP